jgi:hypothetical protein
MFECSVGTGSHIVVRRPDATSLAYRNRKGYDSIVLQAVVAADHSFLDIDIGWPGAVHDQRVFDNSGFSKVLLSTLDRCHLTSPKGTRIPLFIVADAGYRLSPNVMTPVKRDHHLTSAEERYNFVQSSTRMTVEMAFGFLKGMWRLTTSINCAQVDLARRVRDVSCCAGLHNFLIRHDGLVSNEDLRNPVFDEFTDLPDAVNVQQAPANAAAAEMPHQVKLRAKKIRDCLIDSLRT